MHDRRSLRPWGFASSTLMLLADDTARRRGRAWAAIFVALCAAGAEAQTTLNWVGGSGSWSLPGNWSPANVPDASGEQARHPAGGGAQTIEFDLSTPTQIHSFIGVPSAGPHQLRITAGTALELGFIDGLSASTTPYQVVIEKDASLLATNYAGLGLDWSVLWGGSVFVGSDIHGGAWTVGEQGIDNTGVRVMVNGDISGGAWTIYRGATVGEPGARVAEVRNAAITLGSGPEATGSGGGRVYVAGDIRDSSLVMPNLFNVPLPPAIIDVGGSLVNCSVDLVGAGGTFVCNDHASHARLRIGHLVGSPSTNFMANIDIDAAPGATFAGGDWFIDDSVVFGKVEQVIGGHWIFHHMRRFAQLGQPATAPGLIVGRFVADQAGPPDIEVWPAWMVLGPGQSEVDELLIAIAGPSFCGFSPSTVDADDNGFDLLVRDVRIEHGHICQNQSPGVFGTRLRVTERLTADLTGTAATATVRIATMEMGPNAHMRVERIPTSTPSLTLRVQRKLQIESDIASTPWETRGAELVTEHNPFLHVVSLPIPIEALNTDWGAHWFCDVAGAAANGGRDPRVKPWGGFTVETSSQAILVDEFSTASGAPNDRHGATPHAHAAEAMFVDGLVTVEPGGILDLNGLNVYTTFKPKIDGTVMGGTIKQVVLRPFGTFDDDDDVDDDDLAILLAAFSGPGVPTTNPLCDADADGDVDDDDRAAFEANHSGPGVPAACE